MDRIPAHPERNSRGFEVIEFHDRNGWPCSLQQSSAMLGDGPAGSTGIWLGTNDHRMHLDRAMVRDLVGCLETWSETGSFEAPDDSRVVGAIGYREYDPAAAAGHPDYLESTQDDEACEDDSGPRFRCTRPIGHRGDHAAHVETEVMVARWPQRGGRTETLWDVLLRFPACRSVAAGLRTELEAAGFDLDRGADEVPS